jgi:putative oxidoreductase
MWRRIVATTAPRSVLLVRVLVGAVFLSEGLQKFMFAGEAGAGRFAKIGLPSPEFLAPLVGGFEIVCGTLLLLGLFTRLAALPLLTIMGVAIYTTKIPLFVNSGFWKMAHEARTDFCMLLGTLFLLMVGAGAWSVDARLGRNKSHSEKERNVVK